MHPTPQHILWVEDDEDNREMITFFLEQSDYFLTKAVTSVEALGLAQHAHFDLSLLGDWLPFGKESKLCEQLHEFDPHHPILFYSAAAYQTDRQRGMEAGAQGYLTKPVGFDDLTEAITCLLDDATSHSRGALTARLTAGSLVRSDTTAVRRPAAVVTRRREKDLDGEIRNL